MRTKSLIVSIIILTILLISPIGIITGADPLEGTVTVSVTAPDIVEMGDSFNVTINISQVQDFKGSNFDVSFNPDIINVTGVTGGMINDTSVPLDSWIFADVGKIKIILFVDGILTGVSGEGYLAKIQFQSISPGTSNINLSDGKIANKYVQEIPAEWNNDTTQIEGTLYTISIGVTGQGSVTKNPDKLSYPQGATVELTANPNSGWSFDHWDGNIWLLSLGIAVSSTDIP